MAPSPRTLALALAVPMSALLLARIASAASPEPEYAAQHVLVAYKGIEGAAATRTKEEAKALADKVAEEATKPGTDFAALSQAHSDDKLADTWGGLLGIFEPSMRVLPPEAQKALETLKEGQVSAPVESSLGYHVLRRLSIDEARGRVEKLTISFTSVRVGFAAASGRTKEQALADAKQVTAALRTGTSINALPAALKAEPIRRGMPTNFYRGRSKMHAGFEPIEKVVLALAADGVSDPVEVQDGWWVLQRVPWFHVRMSHLIVQWKGAERASATTTRSKEEAKARASEALAKVKADPASWAQVVAEYSEEPGAAKRAGYLGVTEPGSWVPEFEQVAVNLPPGGFSDLVETSFGWHVLLRND